MPREPWVQRTFRFDYPASKWPELLERWRGTPARLEERVRRLSERILTQRDDRGWSIQENVGHLLDLAYLPGERIEQILRREAQLVGADMSNRRTQEADHNRADIHELLAALRAARMKTVARCESLAEDEWARSAIHPRLGQPMRIVDILFFDSEHDDYHLARIGELIRLLS